MEARGKISLRHYYEWKKECRVKKEWKSNKTDRILKYLHSNTLLTRSRMGKTQEEKMCPCGEGEEDLEHIIRKCERFRDIREDFGVSEDEGMKDLLFGDNEVYLMRIYDSWKEGCKNE